MLEKQDENSFKKLAFENRERLKELSAINQTTKIAKEGKSVEETLQKIVMVLPQAWQYPDFTVARIRYENAEFVSGGFRESSHTFSQAFEIIDSSMGTVEIFYTSEFPEEDEGPFLKEERHLINNIALIITGFINSIRARDMIKKFQSKDNKKESHVVESDGRQLLQKFLNKNNSDRDIYHDLMPFKVGEILLVATLYDAYIIEKEGRFTEHVLGEYHQLNLTSMPRVTGVSTYEEAYEQLSSKHFDMVILMMGVDKSTPIEISQKIKNDYPYIPTYLLLNNNSDLQFLEEDNKELVSIDRTFIWNGDSRVFFAMVKHLEDKVNVENDTKLGLVRVILLVEDSVKYYSRYLPWLYSIVMEQTKRLIEDVTTDDLYKVLKMRARPKILLATNYEEAISIYNKYKNYMLCLISDMHFKKDGEMDPEAGIKLIEHVRSQIRDLPTIIQSSEPDTARVAFEMQATFINKNSDSLLQEIKSFISHYLGFGNFVYKSADGREIAIARSLKEFENHLKSIPEESLLYHAKRNHFSLWLMARGEIEIARIINPVKISDFKSVDELRAYLINVIQKYRSVQNRGRVVEFEESALTDETNIVSLASGSLGGKGRGLAFINSLIYNFDFSDIVPGIRIKTPKTSIIGTDEFDLFMERNKLQTKTYSEKNYEKVKYLFLKSSISEGLRSRLRKLLKVIDRPLAVRSSSLFEDSLMQPFSGIFDTYLLPNNDPDLDVRLIQLMDAIKLVYASMFSPVARGYFDAVNYRIEEEKMAVVIQEVVGDAYENYYYPHISGVAQSYNYYPFSHMKPEEGYVVAALGLGKYVVEGDKTYRFSPKYPKLEIYSPKDQYKNSQLQFLAIDLSKGDMDLMDGEDAALCQLDISESEKHGTLNHLASVYDIGNERIVPGITSPGPRIVNFADILKYEYIPLAQTVDAILDTVKEALGSPVEIEFAVNLNKDEDGLPGFYLLQIKPLVGNEEDYHIDVEALKKEEVLLYTTKGMGNGAIDDITDVIFADPKKFDKTKTLEMTEEIDQLNQEMVGLDKKYVLIGPGRWGTRDRFIGVPVAWPQISFAKVIVEVSMEDFPLDASLGSHFFHNVTTMNVGYFSVLHSSNEDFIAWDMLNSAQVVKETQYFKHIRFQKPISIMMDGKQRIAVIKINN
ncbi:MAG: PEP/pyruvate-binding domain-containing protein [Bacteroidota bacterium]